MVSDTVLGFSIRSQLLALQRTSRAIDASQLRLASGLRVNSALDNPQNFFSAGSLKNRASDIIRLLDNIGQNIQTIESADAGVQALASLVEQADGITQQARDLLPTLQTEAVAVGDTDLRGVNDLTSLDGINAGDRLRFTFRDREDETISPPAVLVSIEANMSGVELAGAINNLNDGLSEQTVAARLDEAGRLEVKTVNGEIMMIEFVSGAIGTGTQATNLALAGALGFQQQTAFSNDILNANSVGFVVYPDATLTSFIFEDVLTGETARRSTLLNNLRTPDGFNPFFNLLSAADNYEIGVNGGTREVIDINPTLSVQGLIDEINTSDSLGKLIEAGFNEETGQITIAAVSGQVQSIEIGASSPDILVAYLGFDVRAPVAFGPLFTPDISSIKLPAAAGAIRQLENEYNNILAQIDLLITRQDTGYRGINLLDGDDMETFFNERRTSSLVTAGVDFSSAGLGLNSADFISVSSIDNTLAELRTALESIRNFGTSLANDLNIIQAREISITGTINTLEEGADKLTLADQNQEGAVMLALQVTQQLAITALSLAANSQRSVLSLFS